jgi:uncharacterized protein YutE (UPF0331/DUF86 family)
MDIELTTTKLDSLARCVQRLRTKTPENLEFLRTDVDTQDIIAVNLERSVQLCVDIALHWIANHSPTPVPETMAQAFQVMADQNALQEPVARDLISAVGFRNLSVHAYDKINWEIVWKILTLHLDVFPKFAAQINRILTGRT